MVELATLLEGDSPIQDDVDLTLRTIRPTYWSSAAAGPAVRRPCMRMEPGAKVILATKLRLGDSNSVMAQGGMQISVAPEDSPVTHFIDTLKGGHMQNDHAAAQGHGRRRALDREVAP